MQNKTSLFFLSMIALFVVITNLDAQNQDKQAIFLKVENGDYNTFSAMQDEAGVKADAYSNTVIAKNAERYTQQAEEIDLIKAHFAAYNKSDWATMRALYTADAKITHNTSGLLTSDQLMAGTKSTREICTEAKILLTDDEMERVITDKNETWVNVWGVFEATILGLDEAITVPVHFTFQIKDSKIIEEHAFYNVSVFEEAVESTQQRFHFIEAWAATKAWTALSDEEQAAYLESLAAPIESILAGGVEIISWGVNDKQTDQRADYDFFAIWSFPNQESLKGFEQAVAGSGWYTYFRQTNISGEASTPPAVMEYLIKQ